MKNRFNENKRKYSIFIFVLYSAIMMWLLFGQRVDMNRDGSYIEQISQNIIIIPFYTTYDYIIGICSGEIKNITAAVINLGGNIIMFIPLGFLMPLVFSQINSVGRCILSTVIIICTVEIIQLFTMLGICDIDDLILNVCGSVIGYGLFKLAQKKNTDAQ